MVVIKTKYIGPTNTRGARIKASANGYTATIPYTYEVSHEHVHFEAVKALVAKHALNWDISGMGYGSDEAGNYFFTFKHSVMD